MLVVGLHSGFVFSFSSSVVLHCGPKINEIKLGKTPEVRSSGLFFRQVWPWMVNKPFQWDVSNPKGFFSSDHFHHLFFPLGFCVLSFFGLWVHQCVVMSMFCCLFSLVSLFLGWWKLVRRATQRKGFTWVKLCWRMASSTMVSFFFLSFSPSFRILCSSRFRHNLSKSNWPFVLHRLPLLCVVESMFR